MPFIDPKTLPAKEIAKGIKIRVAWGDKLMISFVDFEPNALVPRHRHPHEQMGIGLEGEFEFVIGDEKKIIRPGDSYYIPSNMEHSSRTYDKPAKALDIFTPPREEYKR